SVPEPDWQAMAGLAHDLRTPLNALSLLTNVLDKPDLPEAELRQNLDDLRAAVERALSVGKDLLEYCRRPAQKTRPFQPTWFALEPFLNRLVREQTLAARRKGLTLTSEVGAASGWQVYSEPVRLGRLLANLLVNAVRYTSSGSVAFTASWREEPADKTLI